MDHPFSHDLKEALDSDEAYDFLPVGTWMSGGCGLLAESLHRLLSGSEICVIGRLSAGIPDHLVVRLYFGSEAVYLDYDGVHSEEELLAAMHSECMGEPVQLCTLSDAKDANIDLTEVLWQQELVLPFCRYLQRALGVIDPERCDPVWAIEPAGLGPSM